MTSCGVDLDDGQGGGIATIGGGEGLAGATGFILACDIDEQGVPLAGFGCGAAWMRSLHKGDAPADEETIFAVEFLAARIRS